MVAMAPPANAELSYLSKWYKVINYMKTIKTILSKTSHLALSLVLGLTLAAGITYAASWQGTSWISTGQPISATKIKSNFDHIKEQLDSLAAGGGSSWLKNGSKLYYNSGNVGIGTTNPVEKLHVNGDMLLGGQDLFFSVSGTTNNDSISYNDASVLGGAGVFTFLADTTKRASYNSPTAAISAKGAYFAGNVGIGTTNPSSRVHIKDGGGLRLSGNSNVYSEDWLRIYNGASNLHIDAAANMYLNYYTGSAVFFGNGARKATGVWRANGNVGIGTTAPSNRLEVAGKIEADEYCDRSGRNCFNAPPMCTGTGKALQWDGSTWGCVTISGAGGGSDPFLSNNGHTAADCTAAGGSVYSTGYGYSICELSGASCPAGWLKKDSWSKTISQTCRGGSGGCGSTCSTSSHYFGNLSTETCSYKLGDQPGGPGESCYERPRTCGAKIVANGCY